MECLTDREDNDAIKRGVRWEPDTEDFGFRAELGTNPGSRPTLQEARQNVTLLKVLVRLRRQLGSNGLRNRRTLQKH